jgi:mono/diheme cytochrome c family protein
MRHWITILVLPAGALALAACATPNPQPAGLTPIPSLAPAETLTLAPALQPSAGQPVLGAPPPASDGAALGAPIYMLSCAPCHGAQGEGIIGPALRNSQYIETAPEEDVFATVAAGRPGTKMPAWLTTNGGPLSQNQIGYVIAYLKAIQGIAPIPPGSPPAPEPTEAPPAPGAPTPEPAKPSESGGPGPAANLKGNPDQGKVAFGQYCAVCHGPEGVQGVANPGSDDGSVPTLNPIDSTLVSQDYATFAANLDLFIEHGSVPAGEGPQIMMPPFGDRKMISDQQIADLIAYVMHLNGVNQTP